MKKPLLKAFFKRLNKKELSKNNAAPKGRQPYDTKTYQLSRESCDLKSKVIYGKSASRPEAIECRTFSPDEIIEKSREYLDLLTGKDVLTKKRKQNIIRRTLENFENFYN